MANICYTGTATTGFVGISTTETNYDIKGYRQALSDPRIEKTDDEGTVIGFWSGHQKMITISIDGEVNSALDSIPPVKLACTGAVTVANSFDMDSVIAGGIYHESSEVSQTEAAIAAFSATLTRQPSVA